MQVDTNKEQTKVNTLKSELFDLFSSLQLDKNVCVSSCTLIKKFEENGIFESDPRMDHVFKVLKTRKKINFETFKSFFTHNSLLIKKILRGKLVIKDFPSFCTIINEIANKIKKIHTGEVASYIPELAKIDPKNFAISICPVDGQKYSFGEHKTDFSIQSMSKPIIYCLALEEHGEERVHNHVGREPSGHGFNEITLSKKNLPHNPMINAGAIMCCSLVKNQTHPSDRFNYVLNSFKDLCGGNRPRFNNSIYLSEKSSADRNFALAYFMKEKESFPKNSNILDTLDFYFQCCSLELNTDNVAELSATLANAGQCPTSGEKILQQQTVKNCLSLMSSCGMYDFSGEFAFTIGLPAKSGVGGGVMIVVPNVMGICVWSPPLDEMGNSVRGVSFCKELIKYFNFHNFDSLLVNQHEKIDPRTSKYLSKIENTIAFCWAAAQGDLEEIQNLIANGHDVNSQDYDGRSALHIAVSENNLEVVNFLVEHDANIHLKDRWNTTPLSEAKRQNNNEIIQLLGSKIVN